MHGQSQHQMLCLFFFGPLNNFVQLHKKNFYESESVLTEEQCNNSVNSIKMKFNFLAQASILPPLCLSSSDLTLFSFRSQCSFIFHATSESHLHLYLISLSSFHLECVGSAFLSYSRVTRRFILKILCRTKEGHNN